MPWSTKAANGGERSVHSSSALSFVERMRCLMSRRSPSSLPKATRNSTESALACAGAQPAAALTRNDSKASSSASEFTGTKLMQRYFMQILC